MANRKPLVIIAGVPKELPSGDKIAKSDLDNISATSRILGRKSADAGIIEELTLSEALDFIGSATAGDILYRGASAWARLAKGTDGQVLTLASGLPSWATGNPTIIKTKSANQEVQNSSTLVDDTHLSFPAEANSVYAVQVQSILRSLTGSNGGFKCSMNAPSGSSVEIGLLTVFMDPTTHVTAAYNTGIDAYVTGTQSGSGGTSEGSAHVTVWVSTGATAGTIQFRFAQATADNNGAIRHNKGSQLIAWKQ